MDYTEKDATPDPAPHPAEELVPTPIVDERERELVSRRTFLMGVGIALNALVAAVIAVPVIAYVLGPVTKRKEYLSWIDVGEADQFPVGETTLVSYHNPFSESWDGDTAKVPAYIRVSAPGEYTVFAINCAHLGCPVRWFSESQLFMCPCHGGVYYADGSRASGPPERGLFVYPSRVENGHLFIDAGQMPTLSTRASLEKCPPAGEPHSQPALVTRITPCPGTNAPTIG